MLETHPKFANTARQDSFDDPVSKLVFEFSKLPGIGEKTATRLTYFILKQDAMYAESLANALLNAKRNIILCNQCFLFTDMERCRICSNSNRDPSLICVVEKPSDVYSIEQTKCFHGFYHVLHGTLSPLDGIGPDELKIADLLRRVDKLRGTLREVILAINPSVEGEATSLYLLQQLQPCSVRITKLAHGMPVGGLLEYTDRLTIGKALGNRVEIHL